jgi:hypothetical protein
MAYWLLLFGIRERNNDTTLHDTFRCTRGSSSGSTQARCLPRVMPESAGRRRWELKGAGHWSPEIEADMHCRWIASRRRLQLGHSRRCTDMYIKPRPAQP